MGKVNESSVLEDYYFESGYFTKVRASVFRKYLSKAYYGTAPFSKKHSYEVFKQDMDAQHYMGESNFANLLFTYKLLSHCARGINVKLTTVDKITALKLFKAIDNKANSIKCKSCKGLGYKKGINSLNSITKSETKKK